MNDKKWFSQLSNNQQKNIARRSMKYCFPESRVMGLEINKQGDAECVLFYSVGEKDSTKLVFRQFDIEGSFNCSDTKLNSIYRQFLMESIPEEDRMDYLTDAISYLSKEVSADMIDALKQASDTRSDALKELSSSEYNVLDSSKQQTNSALQHIRNKYSLDSQCAQTEFVTATDDIAQDLAYSYAMSFEPKTQDEMLDLYNNALDSLHDFVSNSEMGE